MTSNLNEYKQQNKKKEDKKEGVGLGLFLFCLICFIFGYKTWSKVLNKYVKY